MKRIGCIVLLASIACSGREPPAIPLNSLQVRFEQVPFDTELEYITDLAFVPDGSGEFLATGLYGGFELARLDDDGATTLLSGKFEGVFAEFDAGQLGLALDPGFVENRLFYIATNLATNHVQIRRYTLDRQSFEATRDSEVVIVDLRVRPSPRWHNISSLGFDEEGVMWALVGDKGLFEPAQDPASLLGSLIRIIPSREEGVGGYTTPDDDRVFSPDADPAVMAIGIRSPWKGRYHEGLWYYGDVGLDTFEEINVIASSGDNFGWPVVEGLCEDDVFVTEPDCDLYDDPSIAYGRSSSEPFVRDDLDAVPTNLRSVYVGWIYQPNENDQYAGLWNDVLVFGDAFVGFVRAASLDDLTASWHLGHLPLPTAWGQADDGFVYVASYEAAPPVPDTKGVDDDPSPLFRIRLDDSLDRDEDAAE